MIICPWINLVMQHERKSVSNNLFKLTSQVWNAVQSINACCNPFTFSTVVYSGWPKEELTSHYTPRTTQTVKYRIQNFECHTKLVEKSISYDQLYTSIPMTQWLLDCQITSAELCTQIEKEFLPKSKTEKQAHLRFIGKRIMTY